jgi:hypothetical protein
MSLRERQEVQEVLRPEVMIAARLERQEKTCSNVFQIAEGIPRHAAVL